MAIFPASSDHMDAVYCVTTHGCHLIKGTTDTLYLVQALEVYKISGLVTAHFLNFGI